MLSIVRRSTKKKKKKKKKKDRCKRNAHRATAGPHPLELAGEALHLHAQAVTLADHGLDHHRRQRRRAAHGRRQRRPGCLLWLVPLKSMSDQSGAGVGDGGQEATAGGAHHSLDISNLLSRGRSPLDATHVIAKRALEHIAELLKRLVFRQRGAANASASG
jgi:hypothetical protein